MSAFKYNDRALMLNVVDQILNPVRSHNTIKLSEADARSLLTGNGFCEPTWPFRVRWTHNVPEPVNISLSTAYRATPVEHDPEFVEKIAGWATKNRQHAYNAGLCKQVITELDNRCKTVAQARYLWPTLLLVCNKLPALGSLADKIRDFKQPRNIPNVGPDFRAAMREAAAILTMNSMVTDGVSWEGEVELEVRENYTFNAFGMRFYHT